VPADISSPDRLTRIRGIMAQTPQDI